MDRFSPDKRSQIMAHIKGKDSKQELIVRKFLFSKGFRYRKHVRALPGSPDMVLRKFKTVIFIHGCFWHGHSGCKRSKLPETRHEFWKTKILSNIIRDKKYVDQLAEKGWQVLIVWQCELTGKKDIREKRLNMLTRQITNS